MKNMLTMFAPNMFPTASPGSSRQAAVMLAISSGREVAAARRIVPTQSWPHPFRSAISSPYLASTDPLATTTAALAKKMSRGYDKVAHGRRLL